jgi:putative exporter of polyketide antibiotics
MAAWLTIIISSLIVGVVCAWRLTGRWGLICSGTVPWLGVLTWLLYLEQQPYRGGGASMWLIAQVFAGTVAAVVGVAAYLATRRAFRGVV